VERARKRRLAREKKQQERVDLAPVRTLQPKSKSIRYSNIKSAMAEEQVLALAVKEPALLDQTQGLEEKMFSSELLGKVFGQFKEQHQQGLALGLNCLTDLTGEEISHIAGIVQRQEGPVNEQAFADCIRTIQLEYSRKNDRSNADLMAFRNDMIRSKGYKA